MPKSGIVAGQGLAATAQGTLLLLAIQRAAPLAAVSRPAPFGGTAAEVAVGDERDERFKVKSVLAVGALVHTFHPDTMLVPSDDLLDEYRCYRLLLEVLHPKRLRCPAGHALPVDQAPHDRHRAPLVDYRCRECGKVFNASTGTARSPTTARPLLA